MKGALAVASLLFAAPPEPVPGGGGSGAAREAPKAEAPQAEAEPDVQAAEPREAAAAGDDANAEPSEPAAAPARVAAAPNDASAEAGPVAITTRISPNPSNIGDVLELEVAAAYPRGYTVNLPSVLSFEPLHLVSVEESEPEPTGEGLRKVFTISLQRFDVGEAQVPAFELTYVTADGQVQTVDVPSHAFTVDSLLANEPDPQRKGEDPPISIAYPNTLAELVIYVVLGLLGALALGWIIGRRLRRRARPVVAPPPIPPHEVALEALEELEKGGLIEQGRWQDYYLQLTEIAKGYLEGRFGVEALDQTTEEIRRTLLRGGDRLAPLRPTEVVAFLERCDLVKFARFAPEPDDARGELENVRTMVRETMPAAPAKAEAEPKEPPSSDSEPEDKRQDQAPAAEEEARP